MITVGMFWPRPGLSADSVTVDLGELQAGQCKRAAWATFQIYLCRRSTEQVAALRDSDRSIVAAPGDRELISQLQRTQMMYGREYANLVLAMRFEIAKSPLRSLEDAYFVGIASAPYVGCSVTYIGSSETHPRIPQDAWDGGFYNGCGGESYDLAGRVLQGHGRGNNWNLLVPPYRFVADSVIELGRLPEGANQTDFDFRPDLYDQRLSPGDRLLLAADWQDLDLMSELLESGVSANTSNWAGVTPILIASGKGRAMVDLLLRYGADPNVENAKGVTPLYLALTAGQVSVAEALLEAGAGEEAGCERPQCLTNHLWQLLVNGPRPAKDRAEMVRLLIQFGADPSQIIDGKSMIEWAEEMGEQDVVQELRRHTGAGP